VAVTRTGTLAVPAGNVTVVGMVTTLGGRAIRLTTTPVGGAAPPTAVRVRFPVLPGAIVRGDPENVNPGDETFTMAVALDRPGALAVIVADPGLSPLTVTGVLAAPAGNVTVEGTLATFGELVVRETVKPGAAAPVARLNPRFPVPPTVSESGDPERVS
jgi:hypothetical protein